MSIYKKFIFTLLATTAMLATMAILSSNALAGGSCGDHCTWDLEDGLLTISGTGPMTEFLGGAPWGDQIDSITSVQISNGITSIGVAAFYRASSLTSINIPNSVTSIGDAAFRETSSLTSITIPEGVTSIGYNAFRDATGLTDITIPDTAALERNQSGNGPFTGLDLSNITLHCAGVLEQCKANMAAAGYADGTYNMVQAPYSKKQADGSRAYYDANGKLTGFTGKRIYTLDEANKITGSQNRVSIKYR